ncbi:glycosyltransferase family 4 protein, partial [Salmonella enterica subsp. enterica serovar Guinea]|nr:glycosyltransferase family 4 protein [Salmonella enterica subsp. enterica serovar Guinea]
CFFINDLSNSGGTERITSIAANNLSLKGYKVFILTIKDCISPFFKINNSVEVVNISSKNNVASKKISIIKNLRRIIKQNRIDVLINVDAILTLYSIPSLFGIKCINICWEQFNIKANLGLKSRDVSRLLAMLCCEKCIVLTRGDKKAWLRKKICNSSKIKVIYNPSSYPILDNEKKRNEQIVLAVGRLTKQKGFDLLLRAWGGITKKEGWRLKIVGGGEELNSLKELAEQLNIHDSVIFESPTSDIVSHYKNADIFCLSSRFEGIGLVLLEAQSFGLPSLSFNCYYGPAEILNNNNGYLIPCFDIAQYSEKLSKLMQDSNLRTKMSCNAKAQAKLFTVERFTDSWLCVLDEVLL